MADFEWDADTIVRLETLWNEGHSTSEIGRRIGTSKNSVVGKAHRLGLQARPSPVKRDGPRSPRRPPRVKGATLAELESVKAIQVEATAPPEEKPEPTIKRVAAAPPAAPKPALPTKPCVFPMWRFGQQPTHEYCNAMSAPGKPYCGAHCAQAFVPIIVRATLDNKTSLFAERLRECVPA